MSILITTCPDCGRQHDIDPHANYVTCHKCGCRYNVWDDAEEADNEPDADYGGVFDGYTVFSDADPGL